MNYKVNNSDVGHDDDQHLNIKDDLNYGFTDVVALSIAALQIILPFVGVMFAIIAIGLVLFQIFY